MQRKEFLKFWTRKNLYKLKKKVYIVNMNVREYIRLCCVKRGNMSEAELARRTGQTPQNISNKYKRNAFKVSELEKVAAALGAHLDIRFIDDGTGEPII